MSPRIAVVGLGPAGRALTARLLAHGADVLAIDPRPDAKWAATYGGWAAQLPDWLDHAAVTGARSERTVLHARERHLITDPYLVLDNARLRNALDITGAEVRTETVRDEDMPALADVVVDCRGARRLLGKHPRPMQSACGAVLPRETVQDMLGDADAVLMDWRPFDGAPRWGTRPPSFCYVLPLDGERYIVEETCLAATPAVPVAQLRLRLEERTSRYGITAEQIDRAPIEHVMIPMQAPPPGPVKARFGAAGEELNAITGYSVFASLARADEAAHTLITTGTLRVRPSPWRSAALDAVLALRPDGVFELFEGFGQLSPEHMRAVFDPHTPAPHLLAALATQWGNMPLRAKGALIAATTKGALR